MLNAFTRTARVLCLSSRSVLGAAAGTSSFTLAVSESAVTCPADCSGHGLCGSNGVCTCMLGYSGPSCAVVVSVSRSYALNSPFNITVGPH